MPEVEIAGAADVRPDRLHSFCDRWEIEQRYETATALLEAGRLDLVTIVTLPEPRAALVIEAARAGVPAINAEKVACYRIAEMDAMLEACAAAGSLLTINHQMRFMEQFVAVRNLVRSGRLGRVTFLRAGSRGHLTEQGPHVMDQVLFMNDESPAVWAMGQADGAEGYERGHRAPSSTAATVRFANGACGLIENGLLAPEPHPDSGFWLQKFVEVTGTEGWAGAYVNDGWRAVLVSGQSLSGPGAWEPNRVPQAALFRCALQWVEDRSVEHPCRAEVARRGLEALLAVCRSAIDRRAVTLPLERGEDPLSELQPLLGRALGAE
jgi:predicted dehydrogenase